jgi:alkylation response protein AidB-like acyl-CoA dehydrogenase
MTLETRLRQALVTGGLDLPLPGNGQTALRHHALAEIGREDLSLARLAEAHTDAVAILSESGRKPQPGALYGVWASETPAQPLRLDRVGSGFVLNGSKMFCTGAGLIDRALITACLPEQRLIDVDLRRSPETINFDWSAWATRTFAETKTAIATFSDTPVEENEMIEATGWYLERPGFWHGACGPASCWAGGAIGLADYAQSQSRNDAHTLAHLGAMTAASWALSSYLDAAGNEIDAKPLDADAALTRALAFRHLVEQMCTDILQRFGRAYGPRPLAFDVQASRRYQELELYIRQSHAERDLETLGRIRHGKKVR